MAVSRSTKLPAGVSYAHPIAFWLGVAITTVGVMLQLPDFYASRTMHYQMAGMPVSANMAVGMVLLFVGVGVTAYGVIPRRVAGGLGRVDVNIATLDEAPLRPAHIALLLVAAAAITIDVMKPTAIAFLAPGAALEYGLRGPLNPHAHAWSIAWYPLAGITGTMVGSFAWGVYGDRIGRRATILLAGIVFIATSTCGTMTEYWMNLVTCLIMGMAAGGMLPITFALISETVPARHRGWMLVLIGSDIAGAYIVVSWLSSTWASPAHFGWRLLWLIGLPAGLLLLLLNRWIPESPRYLLQQGRVDEARAVMVRYGAVAVEVPAEVQQDAEVEQAQEPHPRRQGMSDLISRPMLGLSAAVVLLAISVGTTQYGFQQWMPSNLQHLGLSSVNASSTLRNAAIIGFPLSLPVALLYGFWSSKKTVLLLVTLICGSLSAFVVLGNEAVHRPALLHVLLVIPVWGISILNAVLAAYTVEIYPTAIRARASGVSAGAAKAGGVLILALAVAAVAAPSIRVTAAIGAVPMLLAIVVLAIFGPETRNRHLEQVPQTAPRLAASPGR